MNLKNEIADYIEKNQLIIKGEKVLLAVSGGLDSMFMLNVLSSFDTPIAVAHCNFKLRGKEADLDEKLVEKVSKNLGIVFHSTSFKTREYSEENRLGTQEAARILRYNWFVQLCNEYEYAKIATAHHLDDSIETILINIHRGTGLKGLRGIMPKREKIIRPLLNLKKEEIKSYVLEHKIEFREDESNKDNKYLRNEIRNRIIPKLKNVSEDFYQEWREKIQENKILWTALRDRIEKAKVLCFKSKNEISVSELCKFENANELLFYFLENSGFSIAQRKEASKLLEAQTGKRLFGKTHYLLKDRESILIFKKKEEKEYYQEVEIGTSKIETGKFEMLISIIEENKIKIDSNVNIAMLNEDKLKFPLVLRNWQEGDRFRPLGMQGKKKVSDFLIDIKLSRAEKEKQLVLLSENEIVWLVGRRISEDFKIDKDARKALKLEWKQKEKHKDILYF